MRVLKPSWAHERTNDHFELSTPPHGAPPRKGSRDVLTRTTRGLGGRARRMSADGVSPAEQRWLALVQEGLVDLDTTPALPAGARSARCDEVESYVVQGIASGATLRALMGRGRYEAPAVLRAIGRLSARGLLHLF